MSPFALLAEVRRFFSGTILLAGAIGSGREVLAAQGATIEVLHTLRPLVVVMAGANEFDPYKD